uniref:(northern house mosquito) hypothetical protein n=1 Tax=Culex pipiens TaxID=7175 RepID=A0A8D8KNJ1_CULPI
MVRGVSGNPREERTGGPPEGLFHRRVEKDGQSAAEPVPGRVPVRPLADRAQAGRHRLHQCQPGEDGPRRPEVHPVPGTAPADGRPLLADGLGVQLARHPDAEQTHREEANQVPPVLAGEDGRAAPARAAGGAAGRRVRQLRRVQELLRTDVPIDRPGVEQNARGGPVSLHDVA